MILALIVRGALVLVKKSNINTPFFSLATAQTHGAYEHDLKDIQKGLNRENMDDIFYRIYSGARMIGGQKKAEGKNI